jgi:hypothetical protein
MEIQKMKLFILSRHFRRFRYRFMNHSFRCSYFSFLFLMISLFFISCSSERPSVTDRETEFLPPEWAVNSNIYQVNIRRYTPEGTFNAFAEDLPRLQEMGVNILWLMPVFPIGEDSRTGSPDSLYSIADYTDINSEFGTKDDFRNLVEKARDLGMRVIIDWAAHYTARDAVWTKTNPEFYKTGENGEFSSPGPGRDDVIQLDVENRDMQEAMIRAMEYWVEEYNIDGYHADSAHMIPAGFWITARERLEKIKPVFMLAGAEEPELHRAFDMTYALDYARTIRDIADGEAGLADLDAALERNFERFDKNTTGCSSQTYMVQVQGREEITKFTEIISITWLYFQPPSGECR